MRPHTRTLVITVAHPLIGAGTRGDRVVDDSGQRQRAGETPPDRETITSIGTPTRGAASFISIIIISLYFALTFTGFFGYLYTVTIIGGTGRDIYAVG